MRVWPPVLPPVLSMRAILLAAAAGVSLLWVTAGSAGTPDPAFIRLDMDPSTPGVQEHATYPLGTDEIQIDVVVENAQAIGAFEVYLAFNPIYLEFRDWMQGPFLGSTGRHVTCHEIITENTLRLGCTTSGPPPPDGPSGSGVLARLFFHPRFAGYTCVTTLIVETAEVFGHALPTVGQGGCVSIVGPTPTPTPLATNTAVPTATRTHTPVPSATRTVAPTRTVQPTKTVTVTRTVPTTSTPASTHTPRITPSRTVRPSTSTPRPGATVTRTPRTSVGTSTVTLTGTPSPFSTVIAGRDLPTGGGSSAPTGPTGLPSAGGRFGTSGRDWVVTGMALTIGILIVVLLRQNLRRDGESE